MERYTTPKCKLVLHVVQVVIIHVVLILTAVRLFTKPRTQPTTRTDSMGLAMGAKSLVIIAYQILTEHVGMFSRWASKKANLILNCLEIVFWAAVAFMAIQANVSQVCSGSSCGLNWAVAAVAILTSISAVYASIISRVEYRDAKRRADDSRKHISSNSSDGGFQQEQMLHPLSARIIHQGRGGEHV